MQNQYNKKKSSIDISIITPFYKGNKYIPGLLDMLAENMQNMEDDSVKMEYILINDSPEEEIEYDKECDFGFDICCFDNSENLGIHASRCVGIRKARGKYIVMLDQDDMLDKNWLNAQWNAIGGNDFVISNALYCQKRVKLLAYKNEEEMRDHCNKWALCLKGNKIISPGQVLIRKAIIPPIWMKCHMKNNGADDYLLWILLFEQKSRVVYNPKAVYYHCYSRESVSHRSNLMRRSETEMAHLICKYHLVSFIRRIIYRARYIKR